MHDQILTYRRVKFIPNSSNGSSIVQAKLEVLRHCLHRIKIHTPASTVELQDDEDRQDIISVKLERACSELRRYRGTRDFRLGYSAPLHAGMSLIDSTELANEGDESHGIEHQEQGRRTTDR